MKKIVLQADLSRSYNQYGNNIVPFVFQFDYEFYLILYPQYMEYGSHLDMKEKFLNQIMKIKKYENTRIKRGYKLREVKKDILSGVVFKSNVDEICYEYSDNAGKEYCFVKSHSHIDYIEFQFNYKENYEKAIQVIDDDKLIEDVYKSNLKAQIKSLYLDNWSELVYTNEYEQVTLSQLILKFSIKKCRQSKAK